MSENAARPPVGEVIASTTTRFTAQCPRPLLYLPPVFGAFVRIVPEPPAPRNNSPLAASSEQPATSDHQLATVFDPFADPKPLPATGLPAGIPDGTLYAVVFSAGTGSAEPGRRPTAYGLEEEQLRRQQPQIFDLLATEFSALHVGYARDAAFRAGIPPRPSRLHAAVSDCSPEEVCAVTASPEFLRALITAPGDVPVDEMIVACLRHAVACRGDDYPYLVRAGKQLAALLRDDPDRLTALLWRLEPD